MPDILSGKEKQFYTQILAAIRGQRWAEAKALLADAKGGPLDDFLRAEYWLAANSPRAELSDLMPILARSPWPPQAAQLGRLATRRGATDLPTLPPDENGRGSRREKSVTRCRSRWASDHVITKN